MPYKNGGVSVSIVNRGSDGDPDNYVEVQLPLKMNQPEYRGRGTLIKLEHGFSRVVVEAQDDTTLSIEAHRDGQEPRLFILRNGYLSDAEGQLKWAVDQLNDPDQPIDLVDELDWLTIGGQTLPKQD